MSSISIAHVAGWSEDPSPPTAPVTPASNHGVRPILITIAQLALTPQAVGDKGSTPCPVGPFSARGRNGQEACLRAQVGPRIRATRGPIHPRTPPKAAVRSHRDIAGPSNPNSGCDASRRPPNQHVEAASPLFAPPAIQQLCPTETPTGTSAASAPPSSPPAPCYMGSAAPPDLLTTTTRWSDRSRSRVRRGEPWDPTLGQEMKGRPTPLLQGPADPTVQDRNRQMPDRTPNGLNPGA